MNHPKRIAELILGSWGWELEGEDLLKCIKFQLDICLSVDADLEINHDEVADVIKEYNALTKSKREVRDASQEIYNELNKQEKDALASNE